MEILSSLIVEWFRNRYAGTLADPRSIPEDISVSEEFLVLIMMPIFHIQKNLLSMSKKI